MQCKLYAHEKNVKEGSLEIFQACSLHGHKTESLPIREKLPTDPRPSKEHRSTLPKAANLFSHQVSAMLARCHYCHLFITQQSQQDSMRKCSGSLRSSSSSSFVDLKMRFASPSAVFTLEKRAATHAGDSPRIPAVRRQLAEFD